MTTSTLAWMEGGEKSGPRGQPAPRRQAFVDKVVAGSTTRRLCFTATRGVCQEERIRRFHQRNRASGAQPEIASKAVREDIEDRLHGQAAELRSCGRARRQVARVASFSSASSTVRPAYSL